MRISVAEAKWYEDRNHWKINVQKDGVRRSFYDSTPGKKGKAICERKAADWLDSVSITDPRFDVAWQTFIDKANVGEAYLTNLKGFGTTWLLPALGRKKLSAITAQDVQDILDSMAKQGRAAKTIANVRGAFTAFLKFCRRNRYEIEQFTDLEISREAPKGKKHILSRKDIETVFTDDRITDHGKWIHDHYIHAYRFAILTGERRGEIAGLKWEDISDEAIDISRAINRLEIMTDGKNENAQRCIPMNKAIRKVLEDQKAYLKTVGIISPYVFPDEACSEINPPRPFYDHWQRYLKCHNIPKITFHELRHTMISTFKADLPEELLKQVVGHSASMDTFGVYGHLADGDAERTAKIMDNVVSGILSSVV